MAKFHNNGFSSSPFALQLNTNMGERLKINLVLTSIILLNHVCWTQVGEGFVNHYTSTYVQLCYDACSMHDNDYYWCSTRKGWDYCSVWENTDYRGNKCRDDHPCEKHGRDYYWCHNKAGGWGYCGKVEPKNLLYISSTYQSVCKDECLYDEEHLYYWCYTDKGWDYCSPTVDGTFQNVPCNVDHPCDTHGEAYTWCRTHSGWNYCGLIQSAGYNVTRRQKRQPNNLELICTYSDRHNNRETRIYAEPNPRDIADGTPWRNEIGNIISRWNNGYLGDQARSELITSDHLRIDLQGLVNRNNLNRNNQNRNTLRYYNLQIQVNVRRQPGSSTTVAQVLIPQNEDVPDRYVRRAFKESVDHRARVFVDVIHGISPVIKPEQNCG
ncbi:uncharacterized protein LOC128508824 [Clarias gariepinus]|uniref:uncharacterized protein LOC128508824 n=1 Tax=Clarias gariepinus TaxID=13013 RepID=UPI00234CCA1A|nr:uncharacterized protein LOC128508824 [Clarias gariepinus]